MRGPVSDSTATGAVGRVHPVLDDGDAVPTDGEPPLAGILVIDLSRALAGPIAAMALGDLGARVIKVEEPVHGDDTRSWGPPFEGPQDDPQSPYFMSGNRNKESIRLDLKSDFGRDTLGRLVRRADVLIENFRPGVMDRLGFSAEKLAQLNPRLVQLSVTGFGSSGPSGSRPGYDQIIQGEAGLMSVTGSAEQAPVRIGVPVSDVLAAVNGALGVCAALLRRHRTRSGAVVRTSLLAAAVSAHTFHGTNWTVSGVLPEPSGNHHPRIAPYGAFRCADGLVQVGVGSQGLWRRFAPIVDIDPDAPPFALGSSRLTNRDDLTAAIEAAFSTLTRDEVLQRCDAAGVPCGAIRTIDEVYDSEQVHSQGLVVTVDHSVLGPIRLPGPPLQFETASGESVGRRTHEAPPTLGEHDETVLAWLDGAAEAPDADGGPQGQHRRAADYEPPTGTQTIRSTTKGTP